MESLEDVVRWRAATGRWEIRRVKSRESSETSTWHPVLASAGLLGCGRLVGEQGHKRSGDRYSQAVNGFFSAAGTTTTTTTDDDNDNDDDDDNVD